MAEIDRIDTQAESPATFTGLKLSHPSSSAAGIPAVAKSISHLINESGIFRSVKAMNALNQFKGFDCPGCAWPDPDDERSRLGEYCENGAKAIAEEATLKKIGAGFFATHSIQELSKLSDYEIGKLGRIAEPMYLPAGADHYQPVTWEKAFSIAAKHLTELDSPDEAVFYTSGRTSNEAAFLYQLFVRAFGTNNLPDCSNMCHESSGVALTESLGIGKGSVTLEDFEKAEVILILGQNPGTNHPRMLSALQNAKSRGAKIISVNPLRETGLLAFNNPQKLQGWIGTATPLSDLFLQVRINGDMPLLQWLSKNLIHAHENSPAVNIIDSEFINNNTSGYQELREHLVRMDDNLLLEQCGIDRQHAQEALEILKQKNKIIACWAMGLTQHENAVNTIREIVNLLLLKGSIGRAGAGTCPVRGHSNVQGDRTVGIYEKPADAFLDAMQKEFDFSPPRHHGLDVVDSIKAMQRKEGMVFMAMGGNFLSATPDTTLTARALRNCSITIQVSTKLNRSHLVTGKEALILPCLARSDKDEFNGTTRFVSCENSMGVVQASTGNLKPVSPTLLSEPDIVIRLAEQVLQNRFGINWQSFLNYDVIRDSIERVIPGFENYNSRVREKGGFYLPNVNREGRYLTPDGKAHFSINSFQSKILKEDEIIMMTIRSHDQFNTTLYGLDDRYRGVRNERRVIFMNSIDIARFNLNTGDVVDLINRTGGIIRIAHRFIVIPYDIPPGCCATYFPETNVLVPITSVAEKSNTPVSKNVIISVVPSTQDVPV